MVSETRIIIEPKNMVLCLTCKRCGNETVLRLSTGYRPPSPCPFCQLGWAELWDNNNWVPDHATRFDSFVDALRTLWRVNEQEGSPVTIRLEIREQ